MAVAKLRHVAISVRGPEAQQEAIKFYSEVFGMKEVARADSEQGKAVYMSDGVICLALVDFSNDEHRDRHDGMGPVYGLHHIGFWVEDEEEIKRRLESAKAEYRYSRPTEHVNVYYESKYLSPHGVQIDITEDGWAGALPIEAKHDTEPKSA